VLDNAGGSVEDTRKNLEALKEAYRMYHETRGGNVHTWLDLMADDVCFRSLAGGAAPMSFTLDCRSKQEVQRYFQGLLSEWEMVYYQPDEFITEGASIVMRGRCAFKSKTTGKVVETPKADFFRFKNGKIAEFFEFYDTAKAFAGGIPD
jgi:ketosteroid isomerase-like protein